jgi:hypothetical protein
VLLTDVAEVMPLLQRNYDNNLSAAALRGGMRQWQQRSHRQHTAGS